MNINKFNYVYFSMIISSGAFSVPVLPQAKKGGRNVAQTAQNISQPQAKKGGRNVAQAAQNISQPQAKKGGRNVEKSVQNVSQSQVQEHSSNLAKTLPGHVPQKKFLSLELRRNQKKIQEKNTFTTQSKFMDFEQSLQAQKALWNRDKPRTELNLILQTKKLCYDLKKGIHETKNALEHHVANAPEFKNSLEEDLEHLKEALGRQSKFVSQSLENKKLRAKERNNH
ncbi:hypothetical protein [Holospora curviuscula]|uniref:Uncharacterized protein n=1 Tax=Holospora curviuscula TaxID=1082868 RepID=A0A2S5R6U9_9PROT|nr:hypothetical protein [Holospora curviuscula]PPE03013.1 hypothetical protein HCUR_01546 [Holospora curviuscula]